MVNDKTRLLFAARHGRMLHDVNSDLHGCATIQRFHPKSKPRPTDPWGVYADTATLIILKLRLIDFDIAPIGGWRENLLPRSDVPETEPLDGAW